MQRKDFSQHTPAARSKISSVKKRKNASVEIAAEVENVELLIILFGALCCISVIEGAI